MQKVSLKNIFSLKGYSTLSKSILSWFLAPTLRKKPGIVDKLVVHFLQTFLVKKCQQLFKLQFV